MMLRSTGPTSVIDMTEAGGQDEMHVVVVKSGGGTVTVEGSTELAGTYTTIATVTVPESGEYRDRVPLDWPRYIRAAATGATLDIRM